MAERPQRQERSMQCVRLGLLLLVSMLTCWSLPKMRPSICPLTCQEGRDRPASEERQGEWSDPEARAAIPQAALRHASPIGALSWPSTGELRGYFIHFYLACGVRLWERGLPAAWSAWSAGLQQPHPFALAPRRQRRLPTLPLSPSRTGVGRAAAILLKHALVLSLAPFQHGRAARLARKWRARTYALAHRVAPAAGEQDVAAALVRVVQLSWVRPRRFVRTRARQGQRLYHAAAHAALRRPAPRAGE